MTKEQQSEQELSSRRNRSFKVWQNIDQWNLWATRARRIVLLTWLGIGAVGLSAVASFIANQYDGQGVRILLGAMILAIFLMVLLFAAVLFLEITRLLRRQRATGPTQRRLITLFVLMALIPTVLVANFSTITLNVGLENWFSSRVKNVVDSSYNAALAYSQEHDEGIRREGQIVYQSLSISLNTDPNVQKSLVYYLNQAVLPVSETVKRAFVISGTGELVARGSDSYLFNYHQPSQVEFNEAFAGDTVVIKDLPNNEFRFLRLLDSNLDYYVYVTREVDGQILTLLNQTEENAKFYRNSEKSRQKLLLWFALFYLFMAIIILMIAIWAAIYFSSKLTRPISQLVRAVERISDGDLDARVMEMNDNDEFSLLSRSFNQMTAEMQQSHQDLQLAGERSEAESRRFNNVLEGVSSGVIGTDRRGKITFINSAALKLLDVKKQTKSMQIENIAPEFHEIMQDLQASDTREKQEQVSLLRGGTQETLFVRISQSDQNRSGNFIISFDVVSDLVHAQRMAAWGDVARRIAHEIKNPLTPIRLSAERLNRRFGKQIVDERGKFDELTHIIVRQTEDLRRIVDEFSKFSRMPEPMLSEGNWIELVQAAILLHQTNENGFEISYAGPEFAAGFFDHTLMGQALTNIVKNALEAITSRTQRDESVEGKVEITATIESGRVIIRICDNGLGFPTDKTKLFEPYMTLKETGTGLGLPIVKKIIEDHNGKITLHDRDDDALGACVKLDLPEFKKLKNK